MRWIRNKKKEQSEEINRYIDNPHYTTEEVNEETRQVIDDIRQSAREVRPSPQFVNQLSSRLQAASPSPTIKAMRFVGRWTPRLAAASLGLVLIFLAVSWLSNLWLLPVSPEPAADFDSIVESQQLIFPDAPEQLPLYRVVGQPIADNPEAALAWATDFGLPEPELFLSPAANDVIYVIGSDGQQLIFHQSPISMINYSSGKLISELSGEPPSLEAAAAAAIEFLGRLDLLPPAYQVTDQGLQTGAHPIRAISVDIELAGQRLDSSMPYGITLAIGSEGEIISASFSRLDFIPLEESVTIQPAESIYNAFRDGQITPFRSGSHTIHTADSRSAIRYFTPPPPAHEIGETVSLSGWANILVSPDGQRVRATLHGAAAQAQYLLVGDAVKEMAEAVSRPGGVQVEGTIIAQDNPNQWQVAVDQWQPGEPASLAPSRCLIGGFERDAEQGWLLVDETDEGRHQILYPPEELAHGERIEVCFKREEDGADGVNWLGITTPPQSELAASGMTAQAVSVAREVAYESVSASERLVEVEIADAAPPQPPPTLLPPEPPAEGQAESAAPSAPPETPRLPGSAYELGQSVVITGVVQGRFRADSSGQIETTEIYLQVEGESFQRRLVYPIIGDEALLADLLRQYYWRYITLTGRVVPAPEGKWGPDDQAIELETYELTWPDLSPRHFLGHFSLEELEGTPAIVFTDRETEQRYVVAWDLPAEAAPYAEAMAGRQQLVIGLIHPTLELAGLPYMQQLSGRSGDQIEAAETAGDFPLEIEVPVSGPAHHIPQPTQADIIVERIELVYFYEPRYGPVSRDMGDRPPQLSEEQIARPVWLITARSADGATKYTYYLHADQQ